MKSIAISQLAVVVISKSIPTYASEVMRTMQVRANARLQTLSNCRTARHGDAVEPPQSCSVVASRPRRLPLRAAPAPPRTDRVALAPCTHACPEVQHLRGAQSWTAVRGPRSPGSTPPGSPRGANVPNPRGDSSGSSTPTERGENERQQRSRSQTRSAAASVQLMRTPTTAHRSGRKPTCAEAGAEERGTADGGHGESTVRAQRAITAETE